MEIRKERVSEVKDTKTNKMHELKNREDNIE